jgi:hypothetical protein
MLTKESCSTVTRLARVTGARLDCVTCHKNVPRYSCQTGPWSQPLDCPASRLLNWAASRLAPSGG